MSESANRRNALGLIGVAAALALAGAAGFFAGRGGTKAPDRLDVQGEPVAAPAAAGEAPAGPSASAPVKAPAAGGVEAPEVPAGRPSERPAAEPRKSAPAGARWTNEPAPSPSEPAAATSDLPAPLPAPAAVPEPIEVPAGTRIELVLVEAVSSQSAAVGDEVRAELAAPIRLDGEIAVPSGTRVVGRVTEAKALAKVGGRARLALAFETLELDGQAVPIAAYFAREGKSETGKDAATIAAGAAVGTVLGNQAKKNDRGKVIGAILGAGVGTAIAAKTEGETIELPAGARLELTLRDAVTVRGRG